MVAIKRRPNLDDRTRSLIKIKACRGDSTDDIWLQMFQNDDNNISRKYLGRLVRELCDEATPAARARTFRYRGSPRKLTKEARDYLISMMKSQTSQISILKLSERFRDSTTTSTNSLILLLLVTSTSMMLLTSGYYYYISTILLSKAYIEPNRPSDADEAEGIKSTQTFD
jgi:hypothetical protein